MTHSQERYILFPKTCLVEENSIKIIRISKKNLNKYLKYLSQTVDIFNSELSWDKMYDTKEGKNRIKQGNVLYVLLYGDIIGGYFWVKSYKKGFYFYNVFMRTKGIKKKHKGRDFIGKVIHSYYYNKVIYVDIDNWNVRSKTMTKNIGFIRIF